ncbi:MAG: ORF6N domain-containing protein [Armatimonadota bacterium]
MTEQTLLPVESIAATILTIRGQKVIIDADLARLYGVTTKRLNEQVKRNVERFPFDFMFQLTPDENDAVMNSGMRSQFATASKRNVRFLPYAFTEHGAVMVASILNTPQAVTVSVFVVRAFIQQRALLAANADMLLALGKIENQLLAVRQVIQLHDDQLTALETQVETVIDTLNALMAPPETPRREIGFRTEG